jgi:hypothetical protein
VRVLRNLPLDWFISESFKTNVDYTEQHMQRAQCCFDTDWCETRLTTSQMDNCAKEFEWYAGRHYFIRGAELYIVVVVLLSLFKWAYLCFVDYFLKGRYPFQDEYEDLSKVDWLMEYIPKRYRPKKNVASQVSDIHMSARLAAELSDQFRDEEGEGELIKTDADLLKDKLAEKAARKKARKKLKERMKNKNFKGSELSKIAGNSKKKGDDSDTDTEDEEEGKASGMEPGDEDLDATFEEADHATTKPTDDGGGGFDKKTNAGMLRVPFETRVNWNFVKMFRNVVLGTFIILCFVKLGTTTYYVVHQPYVAYGEYPGDMSFTSLGLFFFAMVCDGKEIYYTLKKVIPCIPEWVPYITIDLQEEISSLFVGPHTIELKNISEITAFPDSFAYWCCAAYWLGCFPWCIFSVILRDQFLEFRTMRIVTPTLGCIMAIRAILGPAFVVKMTFSFYFLFTRDPKLREKFGAALQEERSAIIGFWTAVGTSFWVYFIAGIVMWDQAEVLAQAALGIGLLYGIFTGCIHSLPIKPWMLLTMMREGVWMKIRKKQRCPCIYWGSFCTDIHDIDEVFIVWTTEQVKFLNYLKGGIHGAKE